MQLTDEFKKPYVEQTYQNFPPGVYSFVVESANLHTSEKGNISIKVQLSFVKDNDFSDKTTVFDYLTSNPTWKLRSFLRSVGLEALENEPTLEPYQLVKASGVAKLRVQKSDEYGERNTVQNYKAKQVETTQVETTTAAATKAFINEAQKTSKSEAAVSTESHTPRGVPDVQTAETDGKDEDIPF